MSESTDEKDLDLAPLQFSAREWILTRKKKIAVIARLGTYRGTMAARYRMAVRNARYPESDSSNLVIYSVTNRKPMEISKNRRNVAKARFLGNDPSKCVLNKLQASQIRDRCASNERVTVVKSRIHYRRSNCFASLSGEGRSNVTECTNVKVCLACFRNLFVKRHLRVKINTQIFD